MSFARKPESHIVIETWEMQPFLGEKLLRVMTSSFERPNPRAFRIAAKATGHYVNSILASQEAKREDLMKPCCSTSPDLWPKVRGQCVF